MLIALLVLTAEWLVYERDTLARLRRGDRRAAGPVEGTHVGPGRADGHHASTPPLALLLLPAAASRSSSCPTSPSRRRLGAGRRRAALALRIGPAGRARRSRSPGSSSSCPVDRLAVVFVVDLSDSRRARRAARTRSRSCARRSRRSATRTSAGIVAFGSDALVERLPVGARRDRPDRLARPSTSATDIGAALRLAAALFPDDAQKRIVLLSDGNDTTGSRPARGGARGGARDPGRDAPRRARRPRRGARRAADGAVHGPARRVDPGQRRHHARRSPSRRRPACSSTASWRRPQPRDASMPGPNRLAFTFTPTEPGFLPLPGRRRGGPRHVQPERPRRREHDRQGRAAGARRARATRTSRPSSSAALETERQIVDTVIPEALPVRPRGARGLRLHRPRRRPAAAASRTSRWTALQVYVRDLGRGLVMVGGPRAYGAGGYTETPLEETLPVDMGVRDRQKQPDVALVVVIDKSGSMDACHCNSFEGGMGGGGAHPGRQEDRHRQGGDPARRGGAHRAGRVRRRRVRQHGALGRPDGAARRRDATSQSQLNAITPDGQTNIFAGLDQAVQSLKDAEGDPAPHHPAHRRLVQQRAVRRDPRAR